VKKGSRALSNKVRSEGAGAPQGVVDWVKLRRWNKREKNKRMGVEIHPPYPYIFQEEAIIGAALSQMPLKGRLCRRGNFIGERHDPSEAAA